MEWARVDWGEEDRCITVYVLAVPPVFLFCSLPSGVQRPFSSSSCKDCCSLLQRVFVSAWLLHTLPHRTALPSLPPSLVFLLHDTPLLLPLCSLVRYFGRAAPFDARVNPRKQMTGQTGSQRFMAPEVFDGMPYNEKVRRLCDIS